MRFQSCMFLRRSVRSAEGHDKQDVKQTNHTKVITDYDTLSWGHNCWNGGDGKLLNRFIDQTYVINRTMWFLSVKGLGTEDGASILIKQWRSLVKAFKYNKSKSAHTT
jgi:hypothetical protein